jgi:hypothetical protein
MAQKYGIFAASRALRHSSVSVTESRYVTQKRTSSVGLGHLLKTPDNIVSFKPVVPEGDLDANDSASV